MAISDCDKCKAMMGKEQRQSIGCGYEPPIERAQTWSPPMGAKAYNGPAPTVCPGYTTSLPEVIETAVARVHWSNGNFDARDEQIEDLLNCIIVLDGAYKSVERWLMTPSSEGGGGK